MELKKLQVYQISREFSRIACAVYKDMNKECRCMSGQQFMSAIDSIGANIAEGFGRYHYLHSVKFYYNARGSLWESKYWTELLMEHKIITEDASKNLLKLLDELGVKLNNFISTVSSLSNCSLR